MLHELAGVAEAFVVAGPVRQIREPGAQVGVGVADELGFGGEAEQGLDDGEGEEFGVGEFGGDPDCRAFGCPFGVIDQRSSMVT